MLAPGFTNSNTDLDDDYVDTGYAGDPSDSGPRGAAAPSQAAPTQQQGQETEFTYGGDPNEDDEEQPEQGGSLEAVSSTLQTLYGAMGLENGQVDFEDNLVDFASLSPEDQRSVFDDKLELVRAEARNAAIAEFGLAEDEIAIINHYRANGNSLAGIAPQAAPAAAALSHDDLHRQQIRSLLGTNATEQQIEATLEHRRTSPTFTAEAEAFRNSLNQQAQVAAEQADEQEYSAYTQSITQQVNGLKDLAGLPLKKEHHDYIIEQLTKRGADKSPAAFIASLSNEQSLAQIAAKALLFDGMVESFRAYSGQRQMRTFNEIIGGHSTPIGTANGAAPAGTNSQAQRGGHQFSNEDLDQI